MEDSHEQRTSEHASGAECRRRFHPTIQRPNGGFTANSKRLHGGHSATPGRHSATPRRPATVGAYGPRVPSIVGPVILIALGLWPCWSYRHINASRVLGLVWALVAALLIGAGLGMLAEWALDLRTGAPVRRSGSFVGIIILLALLGFGASGWNHMGPWFNQWGQRQWRLFQLFGMPEHDFDQQGLNAQIPADSAIDIDNPRGDVSITAGDGPNVDVQAHEVAFASSDGDAKKIFDAEAPHMKVSGNAVLDQVGEQQQRPGEPDGDGAEDRRG